MNKEDLYLEKSFLMEKIKNIEKGTKLENTLLSMGILAAIGLFGSILNKMDYFDITLLMITGYALYEQRKRDKLLKFYQNELQAINEELLKEK